MRLLAWVMAGFVLQWATVRRPVVVPAAVLALWLMVPSVAAARLSGSGFTIHPGSCLCLGALVGSMLRSPAGWLSNAARRHGAVGLLGLVFLVAVLTSAAAERSVITSQLMDGFVCPVALLALIVLGRETDSKLGQNLALVYVLGAAAESVYSVVQHHWGRAVLFESDYARQYWFKATGFDRPMGTLDHPLALALLLVGAIPLVAGIPRRGWQALLAICMFAGAYTSGSRTGLLLAVAGVGYLILHSSSWLLARVRRVGAAIAVLGYAVDAARQHLDVGVIARFSNDHNSGELRRMALSYFASHWHRYLFAGQGLDGSYQIARSAGLKSSFENPLVMYSIDLGLIFAVVFFAVQLRLGLSAHPGPSPARRPRSFSPSP